MAEHGLFEDVNRPLDIVKCSRGWRKQREFSYWIPQADIEGKIPEDLVGTFFRNGPGADEVYGKKLLHPIDGDGMVCALTFKGGRVHFKSKFVSSKHRQEEAEKQSYIYKGQMGTSATGAVKGTITFIKHIMTGRMPQIYFRNPSNTNVFYWGGKVITCYETSVPHCLDPYTLETLGPETMGGALKLSAFAAHFRIDAEKERLVCISLRPATLSHKPSLVVYEFSPTWQLHQRQVHHIPGLNYAHDFLLLPDYYIFHMTPFVKTTILTVAKILANWSSPGQQVKYYSDMPSKFVIIPRKLTKGSKDIIMVDTDPFHIFHFGTAHQEGSSIYFMAVCLGKEFDMTFDQKIWLSNASVAPGKVYKFHIDLDSHKCTRVLADSASVEFPSIHPYRHGMVGTRYNYLMASDRPEANIPYRDIVKFDYLGQHRQVWRSHGVIGEPAFVPRLGYQSSRSGDEDDGYVIVQCYIPERDVTEFCILDAKDLGKGAIARIKLKHHIPYGFHGTFTPEVFMNSPVLKANL